MYILNSFVYVTKQEVEDTYNSILQERFSTTDAIKGIRQLHRFAISNDGHVIGYQLSADIVPVFSDEQLPGNITEEQQDIREDEWVAAIYDDQWFLGLVTSATCDKVTVSFYKNVAPNQYCWPEKHDIQTIEKTSVLCKVNSVPDILPQSSTARRVIHTLPTGEYHRINQLFNSIIT